MEWGPEPQSASSALGAEPLPAFEALAPHLLLPCLGARVQLAQPDDVVLFLIVLVKHAARLRAGASRPSGGVVVGRPMGGVVVGRPMGGGGVDGRPSHVQVHVEQA
eukprot:365783-Chlamydomonas_euryale.AAC.12